MGSRKGKWEGSHFKFSPELRKGRLLTQMGGKRGQEDLLPNISGYQLPPRKLYTQVKTEMLVPHTYVRIHALSPGLGCVCVCVCHIEDRVRGRECVC